MIRPAGKFPGTFPGHSSFMNCPAWYSTFDPLEELMSRRFVSNLIVALGVAVTAPLALRAQARTPSPEPVSARSDRLTPGGAVGGLSRAGHLNFARTGGWRVGWVGLRCAAPVAG